MGEPTRIDRSQGYPTARSNYVAEERRVGGCTGKLARCVEDRDDGRLIRGLPKERAGIFPVTQDKIKNVILSKA